GRASPGAAPPGDGGAGPPLQPGLAPPYGPPRGGQLPRPGGTRPGGGRALGGRGGFGPVRGGPGNRGGAGGPPRGDPASAPEARAFLPAPAPLRRPAPAGERLEDQPQFGGPQHPGGEAVHRDAG